MSRLVVVGVDSMDRDLVHKYSSELPSIARMIQNGNELFPTSTLPPDSMTAWATIYTGKNPAEHGMVSFADPLDKIEETVVNEIDSAPIRGATFWDHLGRQGKRVCVVNPHMGYPPWPVNGIMIGRASTSDLVLCEPSDAVPEEILSKLKLVRGLATRNQLSRDKKLAEAERLIRYELNAVEYLLKMEDWDLFLVYSSALDYVQHYFWSFCDPQDPSYPGRNKYDAAIKRFYVIYDWFIGEISHQLKSDQEMMLLSDHGHGTRPMKLVNINVLLERDGFLKSFEGGMSKRSLRISAQETMKELAKRAVNDAGLGNIGMGFLRAFPRIRRSLMRSSAIDWSSTTAYVSDQSGMKAYSYGGIVVRREMFATEEDYQQAAVRIIHTVEDIRNEKGERIIRWCGRREDLYQGEFLDKYPEIVLILENGYGLGWRVSGSLLSVSKTHNIAPGSHRMATPVLVLSHRHSKLLEKQNLSLSELPRVIDAILANVER